LKLVQRRYGFTKSQDSLSENFETFIWGSFKTFCHLDVVFITNQKESGVSTKGLGLSESSEFGLPKIKS